MSKTKLLLDLVSSLRSVADDLEAICNCIVEGAPEGEPSVPAPAPGSESAPPPMKMGNDLAPNERVDPVTGEIITLDLPTLRAQAAAKAKTKEQKAQMKALLQKHGVSKLTELPLEDYFSFQKEVDAIV